MALVRALAQPLLMSLLITAALPASAQEGAASGPPPVPPREYTEPSAAEDTGQAEELDGGEPVPSGSAQAQPSGPPSPPTREYVEAAGFGAPVEPQSGQVETDEEGQAAPEQPVSPDAAAEAIAPDETEADPTASSDQALEGQPDLTAEGADSSAAVSELMEAVPEENADGADVSPEGGEADVSATNEALDASPDDIAEQVGDAVPETSSEDATETVTGETSSGDDPGVADEIFDDSASVFDTPAEEPLPEETLPEEALPEETPALEDEQTQSAAADVIEPAEPSEPEAPAAPVEGGAAASGSGQVVYTVFDNTLLETRLFRLRASQGETPEDVSTALDALGAAPDDWIASSPDGAWLLLGTQRFDDACAGWLCLAVVPADLSSGQAVRTSADVVHPEGAAAIASGGQTIVYAASGGPHDLDLWAITRQGDIWSDPLLLTAQSPYAYNDAPALNADGGRVVFDCGDQPFGAEGTAICEAATDGSTFRVVLTPQDAPEGIEPVGAHHRPNYAPDGSIVFQSRWTEGLWRLAADGAPAPIGSFTSEASPCVLPDGRIASLWIGREGSGGLSELKVMTPDGASYVMLLTELQIEDIGCGG
jgi:hypothetical protein